MKTTFSAFKSGVKSGFKMWFLVAAVVVAAGCAKKDTNSANGGNTGYPGGGNGGWGYGPVAPGGLLASAAGLVNIAGGDCSGTGPLNIDFELFVRASAYAGSGQVGQIGQIGTSTVDGQIRMSTSDCLCGIRTPTNATMPILPQQSQVTVTGSGSMQLLSGRIAVQNVDGQIFNITMNQVRLLPKGASGPAMGRISGGQFPFTLEGSVQPGNCTNPSMYTDWSFDPL